jgi:hypothetical protein
LGEFERRDFVDRRKQPTPLLSHHTFFGKRKGIRRRNEQQKGGYVDYYGSGLFFLLVSIIGLNILDALLTMTILEVTGSWEVNPIVRSVIQLYGDKFWIWKFAIVSFSLILLCLHSKFRRVKAIIVSVGFVYLTVVVYQMLLIRF